MSTIRAVLVSLLAMSGEKRWEGNSREKNTLTQKAQIIFCLFFTSYDFKRKKNEKEIKF